MHSNRRHTADRMISPPFPLNICLSSILSITRTTLSHSSVGISMLARVARTKISPNAIIAPCRVGKSELEQRAITVRRPTLVIHSASTSPNAPIALAASCLVACSQCVRLASKTYSIIGRRYSSNWHMKRDTSKTAREREPSEK